MNIIELLLKELNEETEKTRQMLERVPNDRYDWQPHVKSMTIRRLATHIADLPNWIALTLTTNELDFAAADWKEEIINNTGELLDCFNRSVQNGKAHLENATEKELEKGWTMRSGEQIYLQATKYEFIRMTFGQMIHHRAQMGVFLRLLNIPIPGPYGPSADEMELAMQA
ncbi:DinB family protein [Mucilaginibacter sp. PAMB04168]|uniref:DinB family protein n=1 Tax=Mucilaginibacter sp. PAMB04168 TaxID=3138567 RepID=UPI0031F6896B